MTTRSVSLQSRLITTLIALSLATLVACASPEEKARSYYEKGQALLEKNELVKARIEFRNALQISNSMVSAWYGMALIAEREGDWEGLYKLLNKVIELDPKHLEAQIKVARLLLTANELEKAMEATNKAVSIAPDDQAVLALQAAIQLRLDNPKGAVEFANKALAKNPNYVDALIVLATERINAGDNEKAIEYLDQSLKQNDKSFGVQLIKAQALTNLSRLDQTESVYKKLIEYYPDAKEFRIILARFYISQKRLPEAEKEFRKIVELTPNDLDAKMELIRFVEFQRGRAEAKIEIENLAAKAPEDYPLQLSLVSFYQANNDLAAAQATLEKIISKEKDAKFGLLSKSILASIKIGQGDKKSAAQLIDEVLAVDKRHEQALLLKAGLAIEDKNLDEAVSDLRTLLRDSPNSGQALLMLAKAHEAQGSDQLADENYLRAVQASKMATNPVTEYALFLLRRNQAARAEKVLEDALSVASDNRRILQLLAQAKLSRNDWAGAQKVAEMAAKIDDKGALSEQIKGAILAGQQNYAGSISAFKRAYEASPQSLQPVVSIVRTYLVAGKTKEAASFLDSVLKENPNNVDAQIMLAQLQLMQGEKDKAANTLNGVITLQPNNPFGYQQLSMLHLRTNDLEKATAVLEKGLSVAPKDPSLRLNKAGLLEVSGRIDEAIQAYDNLLQDQPGSDIAANNLASLLSEHRSDKQSLERAFELSKRFKTSEIPNFRDTYGWASYKVGKLDEAKPALAKAAELQPNDPIYRYHLGMVYLAKQEKANAKRELEKAIELARNSNPNWLGDAKEKLKGL